MALAIFRKTTGMKRQPTLMRQSSEKLTMKTAILVATMTVLALSLSACNTIQGVGRDITRTGEALEDITT
jgi:predicted small secreted protein